jgi:hypothetical protein
MTTRQKSRQKRLFIKAFFSLGVLGQSFAPNISFKTATTLLATNIIKLGTETVKKIMKIQLTDVVLV